MESTCQLSKIRHLEKTRKKRKNKELRDREYLTTSEIKMLIKAIRKHSLNPIRNEALIVTMFRHGLRVSEAVSLKWSQIDFEERVIHISRAKGSLDGTHPIPGEEMRLLRKLFKISGSHSHVFISQQGGPFTTSGISNILKRGVKYTNILFPIHPHMLRHSCGYYLANNNHSLRAIQMYLGHKSISNTVIYTQLATGAFDSFWKD